MDTPVVKPALLDFGRVPPGHTPTSTVQVHPPSDAVTAAIVQDEAGIFTVRQIVAYDVVPEAVEAPRSAYPGDHAGGWRAPSPLRL